jgi:hypothetical protein
MTKKIIGLYQLITGVFGAILVIASLLSSDNFAAVIMQKVAGVALFAFLAWAGYGLINQKKNALKYSKLLQALQMVSFTFGGTLYKFTAAGFIALGIKNGQFTYGLSLRPIDFAIAQVPGNDFAFIIYVFPIIILLALLQLKD